MNIILAKNAGFCWGVKRVVKLTEEKIAKSDSIIFTYGPLIHNQEVIHKLEEKGVCTLPTDISDNHLDKLPANSSIIIRAHGIPPDKHKKLTDAGLNVLDGTCPHVVKIQENVEYAFSHGRIVLILGDKGHAEVTGLLGYCPGKGYVISIEEDIMKIPENKPVTVVAQSTLDKKTYDKLTKIIKIKWPECQIIDTRCDATTRRQNEAIELCGKVDAMIIIGGKNSANTNRLAQICTNEGVPAFHIENANELSNVNFNKIKTVGVTAGASTPDWIIESVIKKLA
ncbi:MAG: 4-hydroxy-3-methylbut-2-enyl diphosphate reductase [Chlamydiae bacterium]|nr:MAG: 4-hydroxy-3-methylbut-2-enyl diphosphate reductase [Chlamydiota bacterium]